MTTRERDRAGLLWDCARGIPTAAEQSLLLTPSGPDTAVAGAVESGQCVIRFRGVVGTARSRSHFS